MHDLIDPAYLTDPLDPIDADAVRRPAPGKVSMTQRLAVPARLHAAPSARDVPTVVQRRVTDAQAPRFRTIYGRAATGAEVVEMTAHHGDPVVTTGAHRTAALSGSITERVFQFEHARNPSGPYDTSAALEVASAHDQAVRLPETSSPVERRYAAQELDDPSATDRSIASLSPLDPADPSRVAAAGQTPRQLFVQHREQEVARLFGAGITTADVVAARALAQDASSSIGEAAALAEAVRARLFVASEYATVHTLDPARSQRYQPSEGFTACNLYVFDVLRAMGVPEEAMPDGRRQARAEDRGRAITNSTHGDANSTADAFRRPPLTRYWEDLGQDAEHAQTEANRGHLVICAGRGNEVPDPDPNNHDRTPGHYSLVMAENDTRPERAHRDASGEVDSTLESQAGGGRPTDETGVALAEHPAGVAPGERRHTANWNYEARRSRVDRGAGQDRSVQWWRVGHDGHFYLYRGGGVSSDAERSPYRLEAQESMGMDYRAGTPPVQRRADDSTPGLGATEVGAIAAHGVGGATGRLPFADVIAGSFGRHDVSGVRVATGGAATEAARALGAHAYATGDTIAFAHEPDLHLAAHEAAHVVQQRAGVHLDGGLGAAGDVYERHADRVADAVVRGESAEALLDEHAGAPAGGVQRAVQRDANAVGFSSDWDDGADAHAGEVAALAQRLGDTLGHPVEATVAGVHAAIAEFQGAHAGEIDEIEADSRAMRTDELPDADGGTRHRAGDVDPNDATAQALANAWPRRFFGTVIPDAAHAFDYLASQVVRRGLPFDRQRVNIVGIRAMQGGTYTDRRTPGMRSATYDDSFFVLALDDGGARMVREFRGTTEPGGRSTGARRDGGSERTADPDTESLAPDQQLPFHFTMRDRSKLGRPTLTPRVETADDRGLVRAPRARDEVSLHEEPSLSGDPGSIVGTPGDPGTARRIRTIDTGDGSTRHRALGIAIHSGAGDDAIFAESTGCQVVHGDWFGSFIATLRRALDCARVRRGEAPAPSDDLAGTPAEGDVLYSLLDAADLDRSAEAITASGEPHVQGDGALDGDAAEVHAQAQAGVAGAGGALPHLAAVQASFGHHDVGGVRAHVGGPAAEAAGAIGARAYATGDAVAFAAEPELHQAAHEAAHVVQQRGGVRLDGGVGRAGDPYEQHADAVADLVMRGESAEALLDTLAHRGPAGGAAVQREAETRAELRAALTALDEATDLDATDQALAALTPAPAARDEVVIPIDGVDHRVLGRDLGYLRNQARAARRRLEALGPIGTGDWDGVSAPQRGQLLRTPAGRTHPIRAEGRHRVVDVDGVELTITHRAVWGIVLYDSASLPRLHAAAERVAVAEASQPYRAAAARGMCVLGEGGIAAINTYDGMTLTLGPGYAGGRLNNMLAHLDGTAAGAAIRTVAPYFSSGRFNGSEDIIRDVDALARIVSIIRDHEDEFAEAQVREWIDGSAHSDRRGAHGDATGDPLAPQVMPELIGVASYLRHGLPAYAPDPIGDADRGFHAYPTSPSRQLAVVLKLYAQRVAASPPGENLLETILDDRLPNKVSHFIRAATARDPAFQFDLAAAQLEIPCLQLTSPWPHAAAAPAGVSLHLRRNRGEYWDFGTAI